MLNSNNNLVWAKYATIVGATALGVLVGYGLAKPTSYGLEEREREGEGEGEGRLNSITGYEEEQRKKIILLPYQRELIRNRIMKSYSYLTASIIITGISSYMIFKSKYSHNILKLMQDHPVLYSLFSTIASVILLYKTKVTSYKSSKLLKHILWLCFNISIGQSLSILGYINKPIITQSLLLSGIILGSISIVGISSPNSKYLKYGGFLSVGLGLLSGISIIQLLFPNSNLLNNIHIFGSIGLFGLFAAYDTQKVVYNAKNSVINDNVQTYDDDDNHHDYDPINEQMGLYLDYINFFINIVRLLLEWQKKKEEEEEKKRKKRLLK